MQVTTAAAIVLGLCQDTSTQQNPILLQDALHQALCSSVPLAAMSAGLAAAGLLNKQPAGEQPVLYCTLPCNDKPHLRLYSHLLLYSALHRSCSAACRCKLQGLLQGTAC